MDLGKWIEEHLDGNQSEFARMIGVSRWSVSRYVEDRVPAPDVMLRIVRATRGGVGPVDFYPLCRKALKRYGRRRKAA